MIPKFRAWDPVNKIMITNFYRNYVQTEQGRFTYRLATVSGNEIKATASVNSRERLIYHYSHDLILMQSTGLKGYMDDSYDDSEEKDVFSGDVIDIFWEDWPAGFYQENHMVGVVSLDKTGTAWVIKNAKYSSDGESIPDEIDGMKISRSLPDEEDLAEVPLHGFDFSSDDITILGNIYEHTELLKVR